MKKALVAAMVLMALSGCSVPATAEKTPTPSESATSSPSPTPTPTSDPWVAYTTPDGSTTFDLPSNWSVELHPWDPSYDDDYWEGLAANNPQAVPWLGVLDDQGIERLRYIMYFDGIGGACDDEFAIHELDSAETSWVDPEKGPIRFSYQALETSEGVVAALALTSGPAVDGCLYYFITSIPELEQFSAVSIGSSMQLSVGAGIPFDSLDAATAYMDTDEYQTMRRIILSFRFN